MVHVVAAPDGRTLTVDAAGQRSTITLAGVEPIGAPMHAQAFLERTAVGSWILLERDPGGSSYAYRSPDGTLINTLMIREGYARVSDGTFEHRADFARVEAEARVNWRGAWRDLNSAGASRDDAVYLGELDPARSHGTTTAAPKQARAAKAPKAPRASRKRR